MSLRRVVSNIAIGENRTFVVFAIAYLSGDSVGEHGCGFPLLKEEKKSAIAMSLWGWGTGAPNPVSQ